MSKTAKIHSKAPLAARNKNFLWWAVLIVASIAVVGVVVVRLSQASTGGDIATDLKSEYRKNVTKPVGQLSSVSSCKLDQNTGAKTGAALGWAINRAQPNTASTVELFIDTNKHTVTTSKPTPAAVKSRYPDFGNNNGFEFVIPQNYYDNKQHTIEGFALGISRENIGKINFTCTVVAKTGSNTTTPTPTPGENTIIENNNGGSENSYDSNSLAARNVVAAITSTGTSATTSSANNNSPTSATDASSSSLNTVNLLDPSKKYSQEQIDEINKQIDEIPPDKLITISGQVQVVPNLQIINKDVKYAQFVLNQEIQYSANKEPFNYSFDTTRFANGSYRLDVVGYNADNGPIVHLVQKFNIENNLSFLARLRNIITYPWYWLFDAQL